MIEVGAVIVIENKIQKEEVTTKLKEIKVNMNLREIREIKVNLFAQFTITASQTLLFLKSSSKKRYLQLKAIFEYRQSGSYLRDKKKRTKEISNQGKYR